MINIIQLEDRRRIGQHEEVNLLLSIRSDRDFWALGDDCRNVSRTELTSDRVLDPRD